MTTLRYLRQHDAAILSRLAAAWMRSDDADPGVAAELADLVASSILLPETDERTDYVSLNSRVTCRVDDTSNSHTVVIACPQDANYSLARVSVLTPLAMALLGRPSGSVVNVSEAPGAAQQVHLVDVEPVPAHGT